MRTRVFENDSNDMTSMVDVTFLLLIFFVITASFATVKVMNSEPADQASTSVETPSQPIRVVIDEHDRFYVGEDGLEEPVNTPRELRNFISDAFAQRKVDSVLIDAHESSHHQAVVQVCDASRAAGLAQIKVNPYK